MRIIHAALLDVSLLATECMASADARSRVFIAIDGPGASGKSTLAGRLTAAIPGSYLVHVDDFYLPSSRLHERLDKVAHLFDLPRLLDQVMKPGTAGHAIFYQRYDWEHDEMAEWMYIPCGAPVILEGVFCLSHALRDAYTFKIWCRANPELRLARGLERDGQEARSMWLELWMPAEAAYAAKENPEGCADLIVETTPHELER